jgi:hypothetical protein
MAEINCAVQQMTPEAENGAKKLSGALAVRGCRGQKWSTSAY